MDKKLEKKLFDKYKFLRPTQDRGIVKRSINRIMHHKKPEFIHDLMVFGFECDDGWYELIDALCRNIQFHINFNNVTRKDLHFKVEQVKEKYGTLRFYYSGGDDIIYELISSTEELSGRVCEVCGKKGCISEKKGWFKTLCPKCRKKLGYKKCLEI